MTRIWKERDESGQIWEELPEAAMSTDKVQGSFGTLTIPYGRCERLRMTKVIRSRGKGQSLPLMNTDERGSPTSGRAKLTTD